MTKFNFSDFTIKISLLALTSRGHSSHDFRTQKPPLHSHNEKTSINNSKSNRPSILIFVCALIVIGNKCFCVWAFLTLSLRPSSLRWGWLGGDGSDLLWPCRAQVSLGAGGRAWGLQWPPLPWSSPPGGQVATGRTGTLNACLIDWLNCASLLSLSLKWTGRSQLLEVYFGKLVVRSYITLSFAKCTSGTNKDLHFLHQAFNKLCPHSVLEVTDAKT